MGKSIVRAVFKYDYDELKKEIGLLKEKYAFLNVFSAGKTAEGREIFALSLGNGDRKGIFLSGFMGCEYPVCVYLMGQIEFLCELYEQGGIFQGIDIRKMFERRKLYFLPMINPDGVNISIYGENGGQCPERLFNMKRNIPFYSGWAANANGVDLTRNFPFLWEEKHSGVNVPSSRGYKGERAASERETRVVIQLCKREKFDFAAVFRGKGEKIFFCDRENGCSQRGIKAAQKIAVASGYKICGFSNDPLEYCGAFENWFREEFKKDCLLFFIGEKKGGYMPIDMKCFYEDLWEPGRLFCLWCGGEL